MKEKFWKQFVDFKIAEYYYQFYAIRTARAKRVVSAICLFASSALAVTLSNAKILPWLWGLLIVLCQAFAIFQPLFPYEKQNRAANYINKGIRSLLLDVEHSWMTIMNNPDTLDSEIQSWIEQYQARYDELESSFADSSTFPVKYKLHEEAQNSAKAYFEGRW